MAEGDLLMSGSERDRAHVVRQVLEHRLGQREASERLGIGIRQLQAAGAVLEAAGRRGAGVTPAWPCLAQPSTRDAAGSGDYASTG